jgi:glycoprotein endo-alpha-1,2-mannosidase
VAPVARTILVALAALAFPATGVAAPAVSIFYYPWYGTPARDGVWQHWSQNGHQPPDDIASSYYPARGVYSSSDPAVVASQMAEIKAAGIDQVVVSWWGRGSAEDARLPLVAAAARKDGLAVAVHVEPYDGRTVASVVSDIGYLRGLGIRTFFVFRPLDFPADEWAAANDTLSLSGVQVYAQTALVGAAAAGHFAGVYTYDVLTYGGGLFDRLCAEAHARHLLCLPSVGPGFDAERAADEPTVKERRRGATYDSMWRSAIASDPDEVTITSFNEWHEGTQIEPAAPPGRHGAYRYLGYDGAWGLSGVAAETAYLDRTAYWSARFKASLAARTTVSTR